MDYINFLDAIVVSGKNLIDESQFLEATGWTVSDGVYSGRLDDWLSHFKDGLRFSNEFEENQQYTFSCHIKTTASADNVYIRVVYTDGTRSSSEIVPYLEEADISCTSQAGKTISYVRFSFATGGKVYVSRFMATKGTTQQPYEPYAITPKYFLPTIVMGTTPAQFLTTIIK